jgi:peptide deformylase
MYESNGVGLAANQVGYPIQLFVMNQTGEAEKNDEELAIINPVILRRKGKYIDQEGCLSFPKIYAEVSRAESIEVEAVLTDGSVQRFQWNGRQARIAQHEIDHLKGISFVDRLSDDVLQEVQEELDDMRVNYAIDRRLGLVRSAENTKKFLAEIEKKFCE